MSIEVPLIGTSTRNHDKSARKNITLIIGLVCDRKVCKVPDPTPGQAQGHYNRSQGPMSVLVCRQVELVDRSGQHCIACQFHFDWTAPIVGVARGNKASFTIICKSFAP
ncbi:hypothetical protein [Novosphingobium mathurense]|uniref:hypothetical protein n=1 Tax=Novosphingobium mathurense TaxID=428990 RepID=UPI001591C4B9|nr:hypothetical protein [Novosphingobium mathurense]